MTDASTESDQAIVPAAGQIAHRRSGSEPTTPADLPAGDEKAVDTRRFASTRSLPVCSLEDSDEHSEPEEPPSNPFEMTGKIATQARFASPDDLTAEASQKLVDTAELCERILNTWKQPPEGMGKKPPLRETPQDFQGSIKDRDRSLFSLGQKAAEPDAEDPLASYSRVADILSTYEDSESPNSREQKANTAGDENDHGTA